MARLEAGLTVSAAACDYLGGFPEAEIELLGKHRILASVLPARYGGQGVGTEPAGAAGAFEILRILGRSNVALARLFEGHLNAIKLLAVHGTPAQMQTAVADVSTGHLFAIWNTEAPPGLSLEATENGYVLKGSKLFASGVGHVERAVVSARLADGAMVLAALSFDVTSLPFSHVGWDVSGVRGASTGVIDLTGLPVAQSQIIGTKGDYYKEPDFSAGAWRTLPVQVGAMEALYALFRAALIATTHASSPIQRARLAEVACQCETARLWAKRAALVAESAQIESARAVAYVNLARAAVGHAAQRAIELVQRGIGARAFLVGAPVERIARDLSFYLRQPAPDATIDEAAATLIATSTPISEFWSDSVSL